MKLVPWGSTVMTTTGPLAHFSLKAGVFISLLVAGRGRK